ncbi:septal ring lytic transglycosylase RlpA family protein [Nitrosomonas sp. Nm166]|uniref:septal ring lytic transglycosylase RlpA family protein n=1 Tax=Nitrosomonas sp. Nm166 TaxID=1881054 RepID=UPI0015A70536|nr:septal ring lytic transglycosylase RlpA family protein [Nitrosomonas sp. Nm166]
MVWAGFPGKKTISNKTTYDKTEMTAAHANLPLGTTAEVINLSNEKKVEVKVKINDLC